jgi:hypothetical protein
MCEDAVAADLDDHAGVVGDRVRHAHELCRYGPTSSVLSSAPLHELRAILELVLGQLDWTRPSVSGVPITLGTSISRKRYGSPPT